MGQLALAAGRLSGRSSEEIRQAVDAFGTLSGARVSEEAEEPENSQAPKARARGGLMAAAFFVLTFLGGIFRTLYAARTDVFSRWLADSLIDVPLPILFAMAIRPWVKSPVAIAGTAFGLSAFFEITVPVLYSHVDVPACIERLGGGSYGTGDLVAYAMGAALVYGYEAVVAGKDQARIVSMKSSGKASGSRTAELRVTGEGANRKVVRGRLAFYLPRSAEEIVYAIRPEKFEEAMSELRVMTRQVVRVFQGDERILTYLDRLTDGIEARPVKAGEEGKVINPIADLVNLIKSDIARIESTPGITVVAAGREDAGESLELDREALISVLDEVRAESLVQARLYEYEDFENPADDEISEARQRAGRELDEADQAIGGILERYDEMISGAAVRDEHLEAMIKIYESHRDEARVQISLLEAAHESGEITLRERRNREKEFVETAEYYDGLIREARNALNERLVDFLGYLRSVVEGIRTQYLMNPEVRRVTIGRMVESNRSFASYIYEEKLVSDCFKKRRELRLEVLAGRRSPEDKALSTTNEMIATYKELISALVALPAHRLEMEDHDEDIIVVISDPITVETIARIHRKFGPRIKGVVTTSATLSTHWVIVLLGLANPP
ncbi:MAG: hypothetical protein HQL11_01700, partial [Candidatus Omnitrophica bacterium]|nr:hypothetical protein [Candidatus Omnitrophota bacterium]